MVARPLLVEGTLWLVPGENHGRFPHSNSILIRDEETVLIDTGCGLDTLRALRRELGVDRVINTHTHPDHSAGNALFGDLPILVPEPGLPTAGDLVALSERFFDRPALRPVWREFIRDSMGFVDQAPCGTFPVDGKLTVGRTRLQVIHAPGHTVDHCCLLQPETGVLISADIDLTRFGPWYGHPESNLDQLRDAMERVRRLAPHVVVSAHRPPVRGEEALRQLERFAHIVDEREQRLLALLERPHTMEQIVDAALIYGHFPYAPPVTRYWEEMMQRQHLDRLVQAGTLRLTARGYCLDSSSGGQQVPAP